MIAKKEKKKNKILVIEDDKFLKKIYQIKLSLEGYTVKIASNGSEGLEIVKSYKPDLILLDLLMPIKTGFEVLSELSKNAKFKSIPVIVVSSLSQSDDQERVIALGAKDFIVKSDSTIKGIIERIEKILG